MALPTLVSSSGLPYRAYGGLDSANQFHPVVEKEIKRQRHSLSKRSKVFRVSLAGALYHRDRLVHLTVALPPPATLEQLRTSIKSLFRAVRSKNHLKTDIQYRAAWVWENNHPHTHIITNMPYTSQPWIVERIERETGLKAHVFIELIHAQRYEDIKRAAGYLSQYMVHQKDGSQVNYSQSKGWVPSDYEANWQAIKQGLRAAYGENIFESPDWRAMAIQAIEAWIDEQREKTKQAALLNT